MKKILCMIITLAFTCSISISSVPAQTAEEIGQKTQVYFDKIFYKLKVAADQEPTFKNFREVMRPVIESIDGTYGATLVDEAWVIRQVYYPSHFLARGFDLKKVKQLDYFYTRMEEKPGPQLSEPGHGSLMQPALIAMRYPIIKDGKMDRFISLMIRTKFFLKAVGLDTCRAYKIICLGTLAEAKGKLSDNYKEVTITLPSTEWIIQYER